MNFFPKKNIIISETKGGVELYSNKNVCVFCHYDRDDIIDDYVINILNELKSTLNCSIIFVSNSEKLPVAEVKKIKSLVALCIVKSNIGYDFDAFKTGFSKITELKKFNSIYFVNDSFYGPFTSFAEISNTMKNYDFWGITDSIAPIYHIQSYFMAFNINEKTLSFLKDFWSEYKILSCKHEIVTNYEIGVTRKAIKSDLKLGAYCNHEEVLKTYKTVKNPDVIEKELEKDFISYKNKKLEIKTGFPGKFNLFRKNSAKNKIYEKKLLGIMDNPCLETWYTLLKYYKCPIIKVRLLRDKRFFKYHFFNHESAIKNLYPDFELQLIRNHLKRFR